jgi:hypothetical protein
MQVNSGASILGPRGLKLGELVVGTGPDNPIGRRERRLLVALLEDAVQTYQKYAFSGTRRGRRLFDEVESWLNEPTAGVALSFEYVCQALGIDPSYLRRGLERWRAQGSNDRVPERARLRLRTTLTAESRNGRGSRAANGTPLRLVHSRAGGRA